MKDEVGEKGGRETRGTQDAICGGPPWGCVLALSAVLLSRLGCFLCFWGEGGPPPPSSLDSGRGTFSYGMSLHCFPLPLRIKASEGSLLPSCS